MRATRYHAIAEALRQRLASDALAPGQLLPSEAELSRAYGASRVTVRRALEVLRDEGLVESRQGLGWRVGEGRVRQTLARLGTIEEQLAASGVVPERRVLEFSIVAAGPAVREVLDVDLVLRVRRLDLADGAPFARVTVWCPSQLAAGLTRADVERASFYELLGIPLGGATQTIGAGAASASDAAVLGVPAGSPVLRCRRVTTDTEGRPVLLSAHVFPADRTEFVVELLQPEASMAPSGVRLVVE